MTSDKLPLVSMVVISYNSAEYIIETLESILNQTYLNIELIISDDCSTDNTVDICDCWLIKNAERFVRTKLSKLEKNVGIAANCNHGANAARGIWMMVVGADDALLPNCVQDNIDFIHANSQVRVLHSYSNRYIDSFTKENFIGLRDYSSIVITHPNIDAEQQYRILLRGSLINPTTAFIERKLWLEVGRFDEDIRDVDDWPLWLRISKNGHKIYFMNKVTANYRIRTDSVCNEKIEKRLFNNHYLRERPIYRKYILQNVSITERFFINYEFLRITALKYLHLDRAYLLNRILAFILSRPSVWFTWINRKYIFSRLEKEIELGNHEK